MIDVGLFFFESLRGSLAYEIESDSQVNAKALLVMFGYRFGSTSVSSLRTQPPRFEEL